MSSRVARKGCPSDTCCLSNEGAEEDTKGSDRKGSSLRVGGMDVSISGGDGRGWGSHRRYHSSCMRLHTGTFCTGWCGRNVFLCLFQTR